MTKAPRKTVRTALGATTIAIAIGAGVSCAPKDPALSQAAIANTSPDVTPVAGNDVTESFGVASPSAMGIDARALGDLVAWVKETDAPIFSILISRHGKLVFELYTSSLARDDAHYVMSVTKSFTSALVGIAIDQKLIAGDDAKISDVLPAALFPGENDRARFAGVTLHQVLGMSALDAQVPPHQHTDDAKERQRAFLAADNRARFALTQKLLPEPGVSFLYTDITPYIAGSAVAYAAKISLFEFATQNLFRPLGFQNAEWMHQDRAGIDNGAYGLRVRPIDMQKFGVLYLRGGIWNGTQVISEDWVKKTFTPWIKSKPQLHEVNYGNYFWTNHFGPWTAHIANGWKGQRIAMVPSEDLVVTMTADIDDGEDATFKKVMEEFVVAAVKPAAIPENVDDDKRLHALLDTAHLMQKIPAKVEPRMIPGAAPKEKHRPLAPLP